MESPTYTISLLYRKIAVLYDGSETSLKALDFAIDLSRHYGSKIVVIHAKPRGIRGEDSFTKVKERAKRYSVDISYKEVEFDPENSSTASAILKEIIDGGYDAVILGARGKSLTADVSIGSKALFIAANSPVSVFIIR